MDITPQDETQQPISDDQESAKALAGVVPDAPDAVVPDATPVATAPVYDPMNDPASATIPAVPQFTPPSDLPQPSVSPIAATPLASSDLDGIKRTALDELRPLINKVDLPPQERFDTYLMLIRSTDDTSLINPAHDAAQSIPDETRRAEALLDIIKEIDYLSRNNQPPIA